MDSVVVGELQTLEAGLEHHAEISFDLVATRIDLEVQEDPNVVTLSGDGKSVILTSSRSPDLNPLTMLVIVVLGSAFGPSTHGQII